ncbi:LysE family translocator [Sphingomonas sp. BK069]|uniref:LysE family translocator n=1 Tax=Sphingomonas sp. BK069 TaxID=2586979 RepID=UPI00161E4F36|nr:LysE family translocator [Sphingomonas sp. BK069]MBB3347139.1 threonine/homoserine/homoserine lactone efflux protein [Sphingomonas sp. BK069]
MALHTWWLFVGSVFLLSGTPGPNMLHVMSRSVQLGLRRSVAAMAGCLAAVVSVLAASAAGLSTLLLAVPGAFAVLRYAGAAYLVYLGIRAWRAEAAPLDVGAGELVARASRAALFRGGFAIGISNPKLILFAAAFLPQFIDPARAKPPQFLLLVLSFAMVEAGWYAAYALGGRSLARYLNRPAIRRSFDRLTGTIFIGFGVALLRVRPA